MSKYSDKLKLRNRLKSLAPPASFVDDKLAVKPTTQQQSNPNNHFSAGVICQKVNEVWCVAGITDQRFPNDVRIPGGTNKNALWENSIQTLCRELGEELDVKADPEECCGLVHTVVKGCHKQYFFVVRHWSGTLRCGEFKDTDGIILTVRWVPMREFWQRCFRNHRDGFQTAIKIIAKENIDPTFKKQAEQAEIIFHV